MKRFVIILGIVFLLLGVIALVHPGFEYHQQKEVAKIGSLKATVDEQKSGQVPLGASIVMLISGIVLIALGLRSKD
jgi:uncharacterized membrane protein HdeD (DUF308 family)